MLVKFHQIIQAFHYFRRKLISFKKLKSSMDLFLKSL